MFSIIIMLVTGIISFAILVGGIILSVKKAKSGGMKALGIIGSIIISIIIGSIGVVIALVGAVRSIANNPEFKAEVERASSQVETDEKQVFAKDQTAKVNNLEISITDSFTFTDGLDSEFIDDTEYCGYVVNVLSNNTEEISISTYNLQFLTEGSEVVSIESFFFDEGNQDTYAPKTFELEKKEDAQLYAIYECKSAVTELDMTFNYFGDGLFDFQETNVAFTL